MPTTTLIAEPSAIQSTATGPATAISSAASVPPARGPLARLGWWVLVVVSAVVIVRALAPQVRSVPRALVETAHADWWWIALAACGAAAIPVVGARQLRACLPRHACHGLVAVYLAGTFAGKLTPVGVGGVAVRTQLLARRDVHHAAAVAASLLPSLSGLPVRIVGSIVAVLVLPGSLHGRSILPTPPGPFVVAGLAIGLVIAAWCARRHAERARAVLTTSRAALRGPRQLGTLVGLAAVITLAQVAVLASSLRAVGHPTSVLLVIAVISGSSVIAAASPSPGQVGAMEASLITALVGVGVPAPAALAATSIYRLLTFWAPLAAGAWALRRATRREHPPVAVPLAIPAVPALAVAA